MQRLGWLREGGFGLAGAQDMQSPKDYMVGVEVERGGRDEVWVLQVEDLIPQGCNMIWDLLLKWIMAMKTLRTQEVAVWLEDEEYNFQ